MIVSSPYNQILSAMKKTDQKENKRRGVSETGSSSKLPPVNSKRSQPQNLSLNSASQQEEGLVSILHEYFMKNNYMDTLQSFQKDCCKPLKAPVKNQESIKKDLLTLFDQGSRDQFMSKFAQYVPLAMRTRDPQTMKMEFYIQLYFFIYAVHPALGKKKIPDTQAKQYFSTYLQGRGSTLSKYPQFLQYYALTNLQKPQDHPTFKTIFTKDWVAELRKRVSFFLEKLYPSGKTPALLVMYDKFIEYLQKQSQVMLADEEEHSEIEEEIVEEEDMMSPQPVVHNSRGYINPPANQIVSNAQINQISFKNDQEDVESLNLKIQQLMEEKDNLFHHLQNEKKKSQHWQNTYQEFSEAAQSTLMESQTKWFQITQQIYNITDQILGVCRKLQKGQALADPDIVDRVSEKLGKYEKFITMNLEQVVSSSEPVDISLFNGDDVSVDLNKKKLVQLDFDKIKELLKKEENCQGQEGQEGNKSICEVKYLLLQAMRWRIDCPRSILFKREAVLSYTLSDVLGLKDKQDKTFIRLLHSSSEKLVLETISFICALTKDYYGREYVVCQKLYAPCVDLLLEDKLSDNGKKMLILTFQWSSTKKLAQELMIKYDMIKIIVEILDKKRDVINPQFLEYYVALLVNILLHKEGQKKAEEIKGDIILALINLIESDDTNVRSYVNACLYPLLSHKSFRDKAKEFGLLDNITFLLQNKESGLHSRQLNYLKEKLEKDEDDPEVPEQEEQEMEQDNDLDEFFGDEYKEECEEERPERNSGDIIGEELLMKEYSLIGPESIAQQQKMRQAVTNSLKRKSIMMDKSFYDRESISTPLLNNKLRRNISNNNSVYSNKSSNRILKSEMNSRSQLNPTPSQQMPREKLNTVHQNNSQVSLKEQEPLQSQPLMEQTFRAGGEERALVSGGNERALVSGGNEGALVSGGNEGSLVKQSIKPYENNQEYRSAFQTRAKLVRTPPRK